MYEIKECVLKTEKISNIAVHKNKSDHNVPAELSLS